MQAFLPLVVQPTGASAFKDSWRILADFFKYVISKLRLIFKLLFQTHAFYINIFELKYLKLLIFDDSIFALTWKKHIFYWPEKQESPHCA